MMKLNPRTRRGGFTLLEVLLASALAIILMAALYVALDIQLRLADAGRESIQQATITRAITQRLEADLSSGLGPVAPPIDNSAKNTAKAATGSGGAAAGGSTPSASGATPAAGAAGTQSGSGAASSAATSTDTGAAVVDTTMSDTIQAQASVIGDSEHLIIFAANVAGQGKDIDDSGEGTNPADTRRIAYWHTDGGLARQSLPWITRQDLQTSTDPVMEDGKEEKDYVIAEEVTRIQFEYWDGTTFNDTWDGRTLNADGKTIKGPPMAIRVHFWMNVPGPDPGVMIEKEFRHTIAIRSAPGTAVPPDPATTTPQP